MALHRSRPTRSSDLLKKVSLVAAPGSGSFGRKLRSGLSTEQSVENFKRVIRDEFGETEPEFFTPVWSGDSAVEPPVVLLGVWLHKPRPTPPPRSALYLAIWEDDDKQIALVPTNFTRDMPMPWVSAWRKLDDSLESIGFVSAFDIEPPE